MEMFLTIIGLSVIVFKLAIILTVVGFFVWLFIRFFGAIVGLFVLGLLSVLAFIFTFGMIGYFS